MNTRPSRDVSAGAKPLEACLFALNRYADRGQSFIEVHHIGPIREMEPGDKTMLSDLALVCANCHRMILRRRPLLPIDELQALVRS